jgi:hypothetical protein
VATGDIAHVDLKVWRSKRGRIRVVFAGVALVGVWLAFSIYYFPWGFRSYDLNLYFEFSRWVIEGGRLYREVPSQYPPLANLIFATVRYFANLVVPGENGFYSLWILSAWFAYVYAVYRIAFGTTILAALAWLAPGPIYFALLRYDIYPALATLISLFAIRRAHYIRGAAWLGVAAALKGYALFFYPPTAYSWSTNAVGPPRLKSLPWSLPRFF